MLEITVSPANLVFGNQILDAGSTPSQLVTITNDGTTKLHIFGISLTGADAAEFAIENDSGETILNLGGTRTVQVSFDRSSAGAKAGNLSIASNDSDESTVNVTLSGYGGWYVSLPLVLNSD